MASFGASDDGSGSLITGTVLRALARVSSGPTSAAASTRFPRSGGLAEQKRLTMVLRIDVWSYTTCETLPRSTSGETTNVGTRTPYRSSPDTLTARGGTT